MNNFSLAGTKIGISLVRDSSDFDFGDEYHDKTTKFLKAAREEASITSNCIVLKNMYKLGSESGTEWQQEIMDELKSECSKFGKVLHMELALNSEGEIFTKFSSPRDAETAVSNLDNRWFAERQIRALLVHPDDYTKRFNV